MADDTVSASASVQASPAEVFEYLRRPANHAAISGDGSVKRTGSGPEVLAVGDKFGMSMKMGFPYRISSTVVEFEENSRIAWCHMGKHRWRWELEAADDGTTLVTETYDQSTSPLKRVLRLAGFPARHADNVRRSVDNVAQHFNN